MYIVNVEYLVSIVFVSICKKKNHVLFNHLEFICIAVNGIVKRKRGLKCCEIDGNIAGAGTLVSIGDF